MAYAGGWRRSYSNNMLSKPIRSRSSIGIQSAECETDSMSALTTHYLTIEEFDALPDRDDVTYELHEGELVEVSFPVFIHGLLQD